MSKKYVVSKEVDTSVKALFPDVTPLTRCVFIGFDPRETMAYMVAKASIERRSPNIKVFPLYAKALRQAGLYTREMKVEGPTGQFVDSLDGRPHSVEFSFSRFLVPLIGKILGLKTWSLFIDCDFLILENLNAIWDQLEHLYKDKKVAVVKHEFNSTLTTKMDGCSQKVYDRKLWSAAMFFNNTKEIHLGFDEVNTKSGAWLHGLEWVKDKNIVGLPEEYQFVPGHSDERVSGTKPITMVHFTEKAPWFHDEFVDKTYYGDLWWRELEELKNTISKTPKYTRFWE